MDGIIQRNLPKVYRREPRDRRALGGKTKRKDRVQSIKVDGDILSYGPKEQEHLGMYILEEALTPEQNYFEFEILKCGIICGINFGLVSSSHPLHEPPGRVAESIGIDTDDGKIYSGDPKKSPSQVCKAPCRTGDRLGCGIKFGESPSWGVNQSSLTLPVFFTMNGEEIKSLSFSCPLDGLYPAISLQSIGEQVQLTKTVKWNDTDEVFMCIDSNEDDWSRLHDICLNGTVLEYSGQGEGILDVGLAQARFPLNTTSHYYELEIVDPGQHCYIAIGLARKDYPKFRHPGWNKGSIAYHADDGKLFVGSGVGVNFGPRCQKGDILGCGIFFPLDYVCDSESDSSCDLTPSPCSEPYQDVSQSGSEDEEWSKEKDRLEGKTIVQVFFTRNGKTIGQKEVGLPKGGFFPTIGMLSNHEKVRFDLHPLTG